MATPDPFGGTGASASGGGMATPDPFGGTGASGSMVVTPHEVHVFDIGVGWVRDKRSSMPVDGLPPQNWPHLDVIDEAGYVRRDSPSLRRKFACDFAGGFRSFFYSACY